jgi:hypothetical protein
MVFFSPSRQMMGGYFDWAMAASLQILSISSVIPPFDATGTESAVH